MNHFNIGIPLYKQNLNVETISSALSQLLLEDNEYSKQSKIVSQMLRKQMPTPSEKFVRRVEFASQFADEIRRQQIPKMSSFVYYSLDVISFLLLILSVIVFGLFYVICRIVGLFRNDLKDKDV